MTNPDPFAGVGAQQPVAEQAQPSPFGNVPQQAPQAAQPSPFGNVPQQQGMPAAPAPFPAQQAMPAAPAPFPAPAPQQQFAPSYPAPGQPPVAAPAGYAPPATPPAAAPAHSQQFDMSRFGAAPEPEVTGGKGAQLPDMYGRLVVIFPLREDTVPRRAEHITAEQRAAGNVNQQRLTATVVVLDAGVGTPPGTGTIEWGGKPYALPPTPHTNSDPLPYVRKAMWINQTRLISQARSFLPQTPGGAPGMLVGRVVKSGPEHNAPWYIAGASDAEMAVARQYIELVMAGRYPHPLAQ